MRQRVSVDALADELTRVRRRGLDGIDTDTKSKPRVAAPLLERLARQYYRDRETGRIVLIRRLLEAALASWKADGHGEEADFVRGLFFAAEDGTPGKKTPGQLLQEARDELKLDDKRVDDLRRTYFEAFAAHVIGFVRQRQRRRRTLLGELAAVSLVVVALAVVIAVNSVTDSVPPPPPPPSPTPPTVTALFRFDALGGGDPTVQVYAGIRDTPADRQAIGQFRSGDSTPAYCRATGRTVTSNPAVGERPRTSDVWLEIRLPSGEPAYGTLTYGDIDPAALARLPQCTNVP